MSEILWIIVLIVIAVVVLAFVRKVLFEASVNAEWKSRTSALRDPNASMGEIVRAVEHEPQGLTPELHARFWSLAEDFTSDANSTVAIIAQAHIPYHRLTCLFFEDAIESLRSCTPVKSRESLELEQRLLGDTINDKGRALAAKMNKMLEDIAARKPTALFGTDVDPKEVIGEEDLRVQLEMSRAIVTALTKLFEKPNPA